jgi:hypothetical protein
LLISAIDAGTRHDALGDLLVLGDLMIFSSVLVGLTPLLDLLISDTQKLRLSDATFSFWNWVDDSKTGIRERLSRRPTLKQVVTTVIRLLMLIIVGMVFVFIDAFLLPLFASYVVLHTAMTISGWLILAVGGLLMLLGILPMYVLWYVVAMVIFLFVILPIVASLELVVRRIAEYPKGPVLAISVVCGALGALLKVVT